MTTDEAVGRDRATAILLGDGLGPHVVPALLDLAVAEHVIHRWGWRIEHGPGGFHLLKEPPAAQVFYVTVQSGGRTGWLLGPYSTGADAVTDIGTARRLARQADPFAWFGAFGVTQVTVPAGRPPPRGKLNRLAAAWARQEIEIPGP